MDDATNVRNTNVIINIIVINNKKNIFLHPVMFKIEKFNMPCYCDLFCAQEYAILI